MVQRGLVKGTMEGKGSAIIVEGGIESVKLWSPKSHVRD